MRSVGIIWLLAASACAAPKATPAVSDAVPRDNPAECIDPQVPSIESGVLEREAVAKSVSGLAECALPLEEPVNVHVVIVFRADGSAEQVLIRRASTKDCRAIECVRRRLAEVKVSAVLTGTRSVGVDFTLRRDAVPDGRERVLWNAAADSEQCVDSKDALERAAWGRPLPAEVSRILRNQYDEFLLCYGSGLGRDRRLRGRVVLRFTIEDDGTVSQTTAIDNQLPDCSVVACLKAKLQTTTFPRPEHATTFVYPLTLDAF